MEFLNTFIYIYIYNYILGVNHWKPRCEALLNTTFFLGVEVHISPLQWRYIFQPAGPPAARFRILKHQRHQARWMRMRPSRRRHGSCWQPWRTVRIWDPSRRVHFGGEKAAVLAYETRRVTKGPFHAQKTEPMKATRKLRELREIWAIEIYVVHFLQC